jgi:transposase, IS5 family
MRHELARLAGAISWPFLEEKFGAVYSDTPGQPPLPTRLMAGLAILKHTYDVSDEELCARWVENPYLQYFCGEEFFCHRAPFERSSLTRWRQRRGEERLGCLLQESLAVAVKTDAMKLEELGKVVVDTTVQEKAVAFPTDAKLLYRAGAAGAGLQAARHQAAPAIHAGGQARAYQVSALRARQQFKRAGKQLRRLKIQLGRVSRDIERKIAGRPEVVAALRGELFRAGAGAPPAQAQDLLAARARGGVHRQGQGAQAL